MEQDGCGRDRLRDWSQAERLRAQVRQAHAAAECEALRGRLAVLRRALARLTAGLSSETTAGALAHRSRICDELTQQTADVGAALQAAEGRLAGTAAEAQAAGQRAAGLERLVTAAAQRTRQAAVAADQRALDEHKAGKKEDGP